LKLKSEHNFVELLQKHQNIVHKICRIYTDNEHAHKDLFQEISIQLWKAFPKFRGDSKFSTWMYRVGLNTAITLYRKSLRTINSQPIESVAYKLSYQDYDDTKDQQLKMIYTAVKKLNDIDKGIVFLYLENKNYKEISDTLGISEVNARVRMNRIKTKLKTQLNA
jgi:RNA polymerase sigma-70 factor (ECF subfamily)|tara:strand:+ start:14935 stop:15429 length:495 start_codon:yes stop_codon:yes gene_type:complete